ncbi:MAG: polyprenyl diphosphate synthase [Gemmatimonadaceae bacterium]
MRGAPVPLLPIGLVTRLSRIPRHIGIIPDGNRRWADQRGLPRGAGYEQGVVPGIGLLDVCRKLGIEEVSVYGFTKENVRRPAEQVSLFRRACVEFARRITELGAALLVVGDSKSAVFPEELLPLTKERTPGDLKLNLLVNYGWQWDLAALLNGNGSGGNGHAKGAERALGSAGVSRIDLVIRWGGRRRLSGFLPIQCAYADLYVIDTLWPDMQIAEFTGALEWYQSQDVTLGG